MYRGTSHTRKSIPLGPYGRPMRRVLGGSCGGPTAFPHVWEEIVGLLEEEEAQ